MTYSTADVAKLLGLSPRQIRRFIYAGFIRPARGTRGAYRFSFQELVVLRAAAALRKAGVQPARTLRTLRFLRRQLPSGRSLAEMRITTDGRDIVVHDGSAAWHPASGQLIIDFEISDLAARAEPIARRRFRAQHDLSAAEWFAAGVELEIVAPLDARQAYLRALARDPQHTDAHINLGRLLHEQDDPAAAATHYLQVLMRDPEHATAAFNLGVALEDLGRSSEAARAYRQCIAADPAFADAHYNLAALLERTGDSRGAIRHLTRYRRLAAPK